MTAVNIYHLIFNIYMDIKINKKSAIIPTLLATLLIALTATIFNVSANGGNSDPGKGKRPEGGPPPGFNQDIKNAIENNDYDAWAEAMQKTHMGEKNPDVINEEAFAKMVEFHDLMESGDKEGARELMKKNGFMRFKRMGGKFHGWPGRGGNGECKCQCPESAEE